MATDISIYIYDVDVDVCNAGNAGCTDDDDGRCTMHADSYIKHIEIARGAAPHHTYYEI